jgi:uncharacterized membrane protein YfcA
MPSTLFYLLAGVVATLAGGIAAVSGFGIGSLLTPLLAAEYGVKVAVGAVAIPHVAATLLRFWNLRGAVDWGVFFRFGLMNAAGSLLGALLHTKVESPLLGVVLGCLLVFAGLAGVTGYADRMRFGSKTALIAGVASGGFGGLVGNQGGIRSAAMLGLGIQGPAFVATATAIALAVDAVRMPVYFATEAEQILAAGPAVVVALAGVIVGTLVGGQILRRIDASIFKRVVSGILLAIGVVLLATSNSLR